MIVYNKLASRLVYAVITSYIERGSERVDTKKIKWEEEINIIENKNVMRYREKDWEIQKKNRDGEKR